MCGCTFDIHVPESPAIACAFSKMQCLAFVDLKSAYGVKCIVKKPGHGFLSNGKERCKEEEKKYFFHNSSSWYE
jgi:hypothetical protein